MNVHLRGEFAPLQQEYTLTDLEVAGTIPGYLDGRYLRNGPNPIGQIDPALYHWFVGDGMVHGIRIRDGRADWYRNRWVRGPLAARALGEPSPVGRSLISPVAANTNVIGHACKTIALVEGGVANYELSDELGTIGVCDFDGTLTGGYTAHPQRDPQTGELHAVSYSMHHGNMVQYSVVGVDGRARRTVDITVGGSPMMHSFSLTERHVVFYDLPVTFDAEQAAAMAVPRGLRVPARLLLSALIGRVPIPDSIAARQPWPKDSDRRWPYSWDAKYPARVGVMPRRRCRRPLVRGGAMLRISSDERLRRR
jgi:carotenoid cleavage oxygenase